MVYTHAWITKNKPSFHSVVECPGGTVFGRRRATTSFIVHPSSIHSAISLNEVSPTGELFVSMQCCNFTTTYIIIVRPCIPFGANIFVRMPMLVLLYLFLTSDRISKILRGLVQPLDLKVFHSPSVTTPDYSSVSHEAHPITIKHHLPATIMPFFAICSITS